MRTFGTLAEYDRLTGYEPNDYNISETTESYIQASTGENGSPNDLEYEDYTIGMALSSPLLTQEREDDASRRRACHSHDDGLSSSQSSSVGHRMVRPVVEQFDSLISSEKIRILLERQREQIPKFYLRYARKTEAHRGSEHCFGILSKITRIAK